MSVPKGYITRRVTFSAAHRLHSAHFNEEENRELYGKCNHPYGHGHNYVAKVTLYGSINKETGMILNLTDLNIYMKKGIMDIMDHKNLDMDVPFFKDRPSTAENVAVFVWESMKRLLPNPELLYEVKIYETENNTAIYRGDSA